MVDGEGGKEKDQSSDSKSNEARKNDEDGKDNNWMLKTKKFVSEEILNLLIKLKSYDERFVGF